MRYFQIDFLRAAAILGMIAIHVYAYTWVSQIDYLIWNWLHFVVVAFVFCSGFVLYGRYADLGKGRLLGWWKKRVVRLLLPFYMYLTVHGLLMYLLPGLFEGLDLKGDFLFFLSSFTLLGGSAISWLPLLFIQMMLLFPPLVWLWKRKIYLYLYLIFAVGVTGYFTLYSFPYDYYRYVMWAPWSLVVLLSFLFFDVKSKYKTNTSLLFGAGAVAVFVLMFFVWEGFGRSLKLTSSKYPPNFFYLIYASAVSFLVIYLGGFSVWAVGYLRRFVSFVSMQSYTLFFVHYIVLDVVLNSLYRWVEDPFVNFVVVTGVSLFVVFVLSEYNRKYSYLWDRVKK